MDKWIRPQKMVLEINDLGIPMTRIAKESGVSVTTITRIASGLTRYVRISHEEAIRKVYDKYIVGK